MSGSGAALSPWWGSLVSEIAVDVANLTPAERERLRVPGCCDGATRPLLRGGACCALGFLLPLALLVASQRPGLDGARDALVLCGASLLFASVLCCCYAFRSTCCEGLLNVPDPAPLVPPLSNKEGSRLVAMHRVVLIYNPNAGKRLAESVVRQAIVPGLRRRGVECDLVATGHAGHARELAMTMDFSPYQAAVTLGGDGTYHELVNGLLAREDGEKLPVTMIPLGTGNGLAATLRQNMRRRGEEVSVYTELDSIIEWSLDRVAGGRVTSVDVLEIDVKGKRLVAVMQVFFGIFGEVDVISEPLRWLGPARFDIVSLWTILKKQTNAVACKVKLSDGSTRATNSNFIGVNVGLNQHFSDKLRASPESQLDDGKAEFNMVPSDSSIDQLLAGFMKLPQGSHTQDVHIWQPEQIRELEMNFDGPGIFNVDGEILEHDGNLKIRVVERGLDMLIGQDEWELTGPAEDTAEQPFWRADQDRWRMLAIFSFATMMNQAIWIGFAPVVQEAAQAYDVSVGWVNMLSLAYMIAYVPANFPASYCMDVYGCRFALIVGTALNTTGALFRCVYPVGPGLSATLLMLGQVLCAIAQPFFQNMPPKIAVAWFPAYQRVLADTIASMSGPVGAAVGFLLPAAVGIQSMLYIHLVWSVLAIVLVLCCFKTAPPVPPNPLSQHDHGAISFAAELWAALQNGRLWCVIIAFSCGMGSFNCLSTLAESLATPFGFTSDDASSFGVFCVGFGLVGAAVMTTIVGCTHNHKLALTICSVLCVCFAALATWTVINIGAGPGGRELMNLAFAGLGFSAMPLMPVSFEAAVEVGHPTGEGTLAGLCVSGGNLLGICLTLLLNELLERGQPRSAWMLSGALFVVALVAITFFKPRKAYEPPLDVESAKTPTPHLGLPLLIVSENNNSA